MEATLQEIFRSNFDRYREDHGVSRDQYQAANAIMNCCRVDLGYEEWVCQCDGYIERQAHSCKHRSCPRCQSAYTQAWMDKTQARLLPCDHYHVVFTLPHELKGSEPFNPPGGTGNHYGAGVQGGWKNHGDHDDLSQSGLQRGSEVTLQTALGGRAGYPPHQADNGNGYPQLQDTGYGSKRNLGNPAGLQSDPASHGASSLHGRDQAEGNQLQALLAIVAAVESKGRHIG